MRSLSRAVNVRRRGRADNSEGADGGAATTVGLRPPSFAAPPSASSCGGSMGMSEAILPRPQGLNSRGVDVSPLLARRATPGEIDRLGERAAENGGLASARRPDDQADVPRFRFDWRFAVPFEPGAILRRHVEH